MGLNLPVTPVFRVLTGRKVCFAVMENNGWLICSATTDCVLPREELDRVMNGWTDGGDLTL